MWRVVSRSMTNSHRVFLRLLIPNVLFLLFPLLVGGVLYYMTLHEVEREVTSNNMNLLQQTRDILDRRFAEVSSMAMQLVNDTRIMQFQNITEPFVGTNTYRVLETRKSIHNYSLTNNFIYNYFLFYKNSELVFTEDSTYKFADFFSGFKYKTRDTQSLKSLLIGDFYHRMVLPAEEVTAKGGKMTLLTYIQSLGFPGYPQGAVVITVDNREIQKLLGGLDLSGGGWAYIIDETGTIISSSVEGAPSDWIDLSRLRGKQGSQMQQIGKMNMMVTYTTSSYNGWTFLVAQPEHVVLGKVLYIKKVTFTMAFIFLALSLVIVYFIAYRNSRPIRTIMETIVERTEGSPYPASDVYRFIRDSVARLIDNNRELQDKVKKQAPLLQAALIERLLKGEYMPQKDVPILLQHAGIEAQGDMFVVVILQLRTYGDGFDLILLEELDVKRIMVKDILREELEGSCYLHDVAQDQIALLFSADAAARQEHEAYLQDMLGRIDGSIYSRLNISVRFAVGGMYEGLPNVSRSYEESKQTLEYLQWRNKDGMMRFDELPKGHNGYYYPSDLELRLSNLAKAGEIEAVETLLNELYRVNFEERSLSVPMLQLFMNEMWGTLVKLMPQLTADEGVLEHIKPFHGEMSSYAHLEKNYKSLVAAYRNMCAIVNEHKKSQNVQLLNNIVELLHLSYTDAGLCLDSVAERMDISKGYLSQFFKEQTGVNFSDYLEQLRMSQAKELLAKTDMPVYEIAQQVGYSSSNTFCRAFKRINGVSTTAFRDLKAF